MKSKVKIKTMTYAVMLTGILACVCGCSKQESKVEPIGYIDGDMPTQTLVLKEGMLYYDDATTEPLVDLTKEACVGISCDISGEIPCYTFSEVSLQSNAQVALQFDEEAKILLDGDSVIYGAGAEERTEEQTMTCGIYSTYPLTVTGAGTLRTVAGDAIGDGIDSKGICVKALTVNGTKDLNLYAISGAQSAGKGYGVYAEEASILSGNLYCGGDARQKNSGYGMYVKGTLIVDENGMMLPFGSDIALVAGALQVKPQVYASIFDEEYNDYYEVEATAGETEDGKATYYYDDVVHNYLHISTDQPITRDEMIAELERRGQ